MNIAVNRLILKRFLSIPSEGISFDNPTFLVGRNGTGKSNICKAFRVLSEAMNLPLQAVFDGLGGISAVRNRTSGQSFPPNLGMGIIFGAFNGMKSGRFAFEIKALPKYSFEVIREQCEVVDAEGKMYWYDRKKKTFDTNAKGLMPAIDPASLCLPVVGGDARFAPAVKALTSIRVYSIEPTRLREMQDPDSGMALRGDGSNAASVLKEISRSTEQLERINESLASIVPNTCQVIPKKHGNKLSLEFTQEWESSKFHKKANMKFEAFNMSDGTLRALGLLMAVYQRPQPALLIIEEPEATIHPGALGAILDLIRVASRSMQVIITTHSPELLDVKWIKDDHLRIVTWHEGATRVFPPSEESRKAMRDHLMGAGELLRSNALEPEDLFKEDINQEELFEERI
ncbi:MAG: AAA family ATPase [Candidatus Aminicenantes bacterium]|nr:AAA family ATPase [Candidatus Aminicenantes bacterium]